MTIREKIEAVRKVQDYESEIRVRLGQIIEDTSDYHCTGVSGFSFQGKQVLVDYCWTCRGEHGMDSVLIPIEWLYENFDYRSAYQEEIRKAQEEAKRKAEAERKREEKRKAEKAEKEYKQYLELKKKYERSAE